MAGGGGMFSFSDDVLGLGKLDDGAGGTAECGSRPSCFGGGRVCQSKMDAYNTCVNNSIQAKKEAAIEIAKINASSNRSTSSFGKIMSKKTKIIIAVAAVVVLILILKKR